jgi:hypothetical protein
MLDEKQLNEIKARAEAATPGPWDWYGDVGRLENSQRVDVISADCDYNRGAWSICSDTDAAFIANARQDVPALIEEIELLRAALERIGRTYWKVYKPEAAQEEIRKIVGAALELD